MDKSRRRTEGLQASLCGLIELGYAATAAYATAIRQLENVELKALFEGFRSDHVRHIQGLSRELRELGSDPPLAVEPSSLLTHGASFIKELKQDDGVLVAMQLNEATALRAYSQALLQPNLPGKVAVVLRQNLDDEHRHASFIHHQLQMRRRQALLRKVVVPRAMPARRGRVSGSD